VRARPPRAALALVAGLLCLCAAWASPAATAQAVTRPQPTAKAAILVDAGDGHVLYARAPSSRHAIASTTKLMTALLAIEELPLRRRLTAAPYQPGPAESQIGLRAGERMATVDLLQALLLESANDAAVTLARGSAGSVPRFVRSMNERARALGLRDTHYANPIGLDDPANYSSALDLSRLARRLMRNDTFATIVDSATGRLNTGARERIVSNRNDLVARVPWIDGVKTGHTAQAGDVLVGSGTRRGVRLLSVVMGEPSQARRDADTLALLKYGFSRYRRLQPLRAGETVATARVSDHGGREARLTVRRDVALTVRRGQRLRTEVDVPAELDGPLESGEPVGRARVLRGGKLVREAAVVTADAVPGAGAADRIGPLLAGLLLLAAALGVALVWRRQAAGPEN
jgi:serine-type D-Ala-D-Ala carboxypeptidase (penicillin-binding protein 5/6)